MAWVAVKSEAGATGKVRELFEKARERAGFVPNIARLQSLRAATAERGFDLYCQTMDDPTGLSRRERVLIATVVSKCNGCLY